MDLYLMSPPPPAWSLRGRANFKSQGAPEVDAERALAEWRALAAGIEERGGRVAVLAPQGSELSGLPFAADAGHPLPPAAPGGKPRFVLSRMKAAHRQGEAAVWRPFVERLGFEVIELEQGVWEGQGDVASFDDFTMLFHGGRTDLVGVHAAKRHFPGEVLELEVRDPSFHGNMAVLPLPDALLVCADVLEDDALALLEARVGRDRMHFISEEELKCYAINGLPVGDTLLTPAGLPARVRKIMEREGMKVVELPMTELCDKGGGGSRCLVCVARGLPDDLAIPGELRLG